MTRGVHILPQSIDVERPCQVSVYNEYQKLVLGSFLLTHQIVVPKGLMKIVIVVPSGMREIALRLCVRT